MQLLRLAAAVSLALAPFGSAALAQPIVAAQPPLPKIKVTLIVGRDKRRYDAELARTPAQQSAGLMFRRSMARDQGMIFPFATPQPVSFWMENTILPLDIVFIGPDRRILNIAADAKPFSKNFVYSAGPTAAVLELNAGEAARIGLRPGDKVEYTLP